MKKKKLSAAFLTLLFVTSINLPAAEAEKPSSGQPGEVRITKNMPYAEYSLNGKTIRIERNQNQDNQLTGPFTKTSRKCPPFCINPVDMGNDIQTVGELEIIQFMKTHVQKGTGMLIDARTPEWHNKGTIPGSVNIPFTTFSKTDDDPALLSVLDQLGVVKYVAPPPTEPGLMEKIMSYFEDKKEPEVPPKWDFSNARELVLWCNGIWCGQSPRAIRGLLKLGYPPEKMRWYRGGMQVWQILGFNIDIPGSELGATSNESPATQ